VVGDGCLLYKGVVLGGTSIAKTRRHPTLHANVVVGSNACIQGAIEVGEGARIGSGSVIR
jgi:serine O-acetyltransferase